MNIFQKLLHYATRHKIISLMVILALAGGGYYWYHASHSAVGKISYVSTPVQKGSIVVSVSGSGQVASSNQVDLKSKVSENVVYVGVISGQQVSAGKLLMQFDTADAQKSVRNAQLSLDNAKLSLQKLAGDSSAPVPANKQQAKDNLVKDYSDGFNTVSDTFLDLPGVMSGIYDVLFGNTISKSSQNISYYRDAVNLYSDKADQYKDAAYNAYQKARVSYNKNFDDYKSISRSSDVTSIELMINETYATAQDISDAIKNTNNFIQFYADTVTAQGLSPNPVANTQLATLNTYTGKINTSLSNLLNIQSSIKNDKTAIVNSDLDLQSQSMSITQAQNALADAKDNLANSYIYAPFSGTVASVALNKGDAASSGAVAITLITNQSITKIPFNEVDITKIKVGQKAILTFDALSDLTIAGQVTQIDTLGTVTQGVVNYNVQILFDSAQTPVKPGMSITASVITDVKQDVLTVPNSAIKTSGGQKYVQLLVNGAPVQQIVQTGTSNDTDTEIISGLQEGQQVITQTITASASASTTASSSAFRIPGLTGGGGGGFTGGGATRATGR